MTQHVYVVLPGIQYEPNGSLNIDRIEVRAMINNNYTLLYSCYEEDGSDVIYPTASNLTFTDDVPYLEFIKINSNNIETLSVSNYTPKKFVYTTSSPTIRRAKNNYFFLNTLPGDGGINYKCLSVYNENLPYYNNITNTDGLCYVPITNSGDKVIFEIKLFSLVQYNQYGESNYVFIDTVLFRYSPLINIPINTLTFKDDYKDMYYNISTKNTKTYYDIKLTDNVIVYTVNGDKKYIMTYSNGLYLKSDVPVDIEKNLLWVHPQFGFNGGNTKDTTYTKGNNALIFMPWMPVIKCSTQPLRYPPFYFYDHDGVIYIKSEQLIIYTDGDCSYAATPDLMSLDDYIKYATRSRTYAWDGGLQQRLAINMACASPILCEHYPNKYTLPLEQIEAKSELYDDLYENSDTSTNDEIDLNLKMQEFWLSGAFNKLLNMGIYYNNLLRPSYLTNTEISFCFKLALETNKYNFNYLSNFINITRDGYDYKYLGDIGEDLIYECTFPTGSNSIFYDWPGGISLLERGIWSDNRNNWVIYENKAGKCPKDYNENLFKSLVQKLVGSVNNRYITYTYADNDTISSKYLSLYDNKDPKITLTNLSNMDPIGILLSSIGSSLTTVPLKNHNFIPLGAHKKLSIKDKLHAMQSDDPGGTIVLPLCWLAVNYNTSDLRHSNKSDYKIRSKITLTQGDTTLGVYQGDLVQSNVESTNYFSSQLPWLKNDNTQINNNLYYETIGDYYLLSLDSNPTVEYTRYDIQLDPGVYVFSSNLESYTSYLHEYYDFCSISLDDFTYKHKKGVKDVTVAFYIKNSSTITIELSSHFFHTGVYGKAFTTGVGIHKVSTEMDNQYNLNIREIVANCEGNMIFELGHSIYDNIIFQGVLSYTQDGYVELPLSYLKIVSAYTFNDLGDIVYTDIGSNTVTKAFSSTHLLPEELVTEILNVAEPKVLV